MPTLNNEGAVIVFTEAHVANSVNRKVKLTGQTDNIGIKNVEIMAPLNYLSNIWRTLEMPLINC